MLNLNRRYVELEDQKYSIGQFITIKSERFLTSLTVTFETGIPVGQFHEGHFYLSSSELHPM